MTFSVVVVALRDGSDDARAKTSVDAVAKVKQMPFNMKPPVSIAVLSRQRAILVVEGLEPGRSILRMNTANGK
jgi:hypothetical protein